MASIRKSFFYNLVYQIFTLITPFITTPYISRILGSVGVGQYSYTYAIVTYFILAGSLGFDYYAQREIASCQHDKYSQSKLFWEIISARCLSFLSVSIFFIILISFGVFGNHTQYLALWSITLIGTAFDISFYLQGNDKFSQLAVRNIVIRIIGIILIFLFVKEKEDVGIYIVVQSIVTFLSNLSLWPLLSKMLVKVPIRMLAIKQHFLPTIKLFVPTLAVSIYTIFSKILLGVLITGTVETTFDDGTTVVANIADIENGYYDQADRIVKLILSIFFALSVVMVTRNSDEISKGNKDVFLNNIYSTARFLWLLGCPLVFGLAGVAEIFSPWFFGVGYDKVPLLITILSPLILIIGLSNILGRQYLIPLKQDTKFTYSIISGAFINLLLNAVLIPRLHSYGAACSAVITEIIVVLVMCYHSSKDLSVKHLFNGFGTYVLAAVVMFIIIKFISMFLESSLLSILFLVAIGIITYVSVLLLVKDSYFIGQLKILLKRFKR